jgi:transposase-like protein
MTAKRRRRQDPAKEKLWRETIRRHQESGLSVRDFCEREGLKDGNFLRWRRELERRDREKTPEHSKSATKEPTELRESPVFLPVQVVDADRLPSRPAPPIEIVLDGGPTVRVPTGFDPRTLGDILTVLGGRRC